MCVPIIMEGCLKFVLQLATALLEKETLNYDEVVELIGPPRNEDSKKKIDPVEFEESIRGLTTEEKP